MQALATTQLDGLKPFHRGKVRDVYEVDADHLLLVATDRISAFDHILPDPVPGKGIVLTQLSLFWFAYLGSSIQHQVVETDPNSMPASVRRHADVLRGRSVLVKRTQVYPFECIVRGFLLGSGWKDYSATGKVCGINLDAGLKKNAALRPPLFTPSTKAKEGHDENVSFARMESELGSARAAELRDQSLFVYSRCADHAKSRGIIICDTKLEWGNLNGRTLLVDEVLTPDSSRFWKADDAARYLPDGDPPSYDKQVVRNWLETQPWDKQSPPPRIPTDVQALAQARYVEIYETIVGRPVPELRG